MSTFDFMSTQFSVYGKSTIAQFKLGENKSHIPTLEIEIAPTVGEGKARKGNWTKKIQFQIKPESELVQLGQLLVNRLSAVNFNYHGTSNNKFMTATRNPDSTIAIGIREGKDKSYSLVVDHASQFHLLMMVSKPLAVRHMTDLNTVANFLRVVPVKQTN